MFATLEWLFAELLLEPATLPVSLPQLLQSHLNKIISPLSPTDDSASAASSMEVTDRIASLEQRVQMQEDEIQLLKSALADVVRRLNVSEEQQAMGSRRGPTKGSKLRRQVQLSSLFCHFS